VWGKSRCPTGIENRCALVADDVLMAAGLTSHWLVCVRAVATTPREIQPL
jgi:hypothetical protein